MSAIFGFTFYMGRMTEVLTPDIYRAHCAGVGHGLGPGLDPCNKQLSGHHRLSPDVTQNRYEV